MKLIGGESALNLGGQLTPSDRRSLYRVGLNRSFHCFQPLDLQSVDQDLVLRQVFQTLVRLDGRLRLTGDLAESWEVDPKSSSIVFKLKSSRFHNGDPVTAEDVKATFIKILQGAPQITDPIFRAELNVESLFEIYSPELLRIRFKHNRFLDILRYLSTTFFVIVPRAEPIGSTIGSGPYRVLEKLSDPWRLKLGRVSDEDLNRSDVLEFIHFSNDSMLDQFNAGAIDECQLGGHNPSQIKTEALVLPVFLPGVHVLAFSPNSKVFTDISAREEFAALWTEAEVLKKMAPTAVPADSLLPTGILGFSEVPKVGPWSLAPPPKLQEAPPGQALRQVKFSTDAWRSKLTEIFTDFRPERFGWEVEIVDTRGQDEWALWMAGEVDVCRLGLVAADLNPLSMFEFLRLMSRELSALDVQIKRFDRFNALFDAADQVDVEERNVLCLELDQYVREQSFCFPFAQSRSFKLIRKDAFPFISGRFVQLGDEVGRIPDDELQDASAYQQKTIMALNEAHSEVEGLSQKIQEARVAQELGRLASEVAHDLRSPLAALKAIQKSLGLESSEQKELFQESLSRLSNIIQSLLAKVKDPLRPAEKVAATDILEEIERIVREKKVEYADCENLEFSTACCLPPEKRQLAVSPNELQRIFSNLINNSVEACEGREGAKRIHIEVSSDERHLHIVVSDNGVGIPSEILERIQSKGGSFGKSGGLGLGLSHARRRVAEWNGKLEIESVRGEGTRVKIRIPRAPS